MGTVYMHDIQPSLSIAPSFNQMELLLNVLENNMKKLKSILTNKQCDINYVYNEPFNKSALGIACYELAFETDISCVTILLEHGANAVDVILYAALGGNSNKLYEVLWHLAHRNVDISKNTVILSLINYIHDEEKNEADYNECVRLILLFGKNVNATETKSTCTAIYLAAKYNLKLIIAAILTTCFNEVDLDSFVDKEFGSARDMIIMNKLYDGELPKPIYSEAKFTETDLDILVEHIKQRNDITFIAQHRLMKKEKRIDGHADYVLLLCATEEGSLNVVRYLLCIRVDPNSCNFWNKYTPITQAVLRGYYKILEILIRYSNSENISNALVVLLEKVCLNHKCIESININHKKCFDLLLKSDKLDVNFKKSDLANPALHFAIKIQTPDIVMKILRRGASLSLLRLSNKPWTVFVSPEVLQRHLDECVIVSNINEFKKEFTLDIDFMSLLPVQYCYNVSQTICNINRLESEPFLNLTDDAIFTSNFSETKVLEYISTQTEYQEVLHHPVIQIFLYLQYLNIRFFLFIQFLIYLIFIITLMAYIFLGYNHSSENPYDLSRYVCLFTLIITLICLIIREFVQMYIFRYDYFTNFENYLEMLLLFITAVILGVHFENKILFNQLSALAIVLSTIELLLMTRHQTNIVFTSMTMLTTVSLTLLKLLLPYLILITAFAFSFFILFQCSNSENGDKKECNFFSNVWTSILKTIIMLTGEFEAENINFFSYPFTSPLLFILFVFHMNIVLFGVFTALAISDTQKIKAEAETQRQIFRIKHISYWEKVLKMNKFTERISLLKPIGNIDPKIEINLTKDSKLYSSNKTEIKLDKKIISAIKTLAVKKNNISSPFYKKCPALRYPNLNNSEYFATYKRIQQNND